MNKDAKKFSVLLAGVAIAGAVSVAVPQQQGSQQPQQTQQQQDKDKKKNQQGSQQNGAQNGNQNNQQGNNPNANPNNGDKPKPLFGGSIGLKSSRQTKDSATLGFNGVDPNGQVQKSFLTAAPTGDDAAKANQVATLKSDPNELNQFVQDGGLNPNAAPKTGN